MKKRIVSVILVLGLCVFLFLAAVTDRSADNQAISVSDYKLNTYVTITLYDSKDTSLLDGCLSLCDYYEHMFSRTDPSSELYQLNHGLLPKTEDGYYQVSEELFEIIAIGKEYATLSEHSFSIAIEPLSSLWNFTDGSNRIPQTEHIQAVLPLLNSDDILLKAPDKIAFAKEGMGIDLGAIAKGYIADRLKDYLLSQNVRSALLSLGGNVLCIGQKEDTPFTIGIEQPFDADHTPAARIQVKDCSIVTSGTYERCFYQDGILYHHILDKDTGFPIRNELTSVTIIAPSSTAADALSTTCFSLGLKKGLALLDSLEDTEGFFITNENEYYFTSGFSEDYLLSFSSAP